MTNLRKEARGEDCQIRVPGFCNGNPETVVLCHYSLAGISGKGLKSPDDMAAWGCSACHDVVDFRCKGAEKSYTRAEIRLMHAEGCFRTMAERKK
jgi:hypothetical protein